MIREDFQDSVGVISYRKKMYTLFGSVKLHYVTRIPEMQDERKAVIYTRTYTYLRIVRSNKSCCLFSVLILNLLNHPLSDIVISTLFMLHCCKRMRVITCGDIRIYIKIATYILSAYYIYYIYFTRTKFINRIT